MSYHQRLFFSTCEFMLRAFVNSDLLLQQSVSLSLWAWHIVNSLLLFAGEHPLVTINTVYLFVYKTTEKIQLR